METSFAEYRDKTGVNSDSDDEVIDNSLVVDESFGLRKTPGKKNRTLFIAESEESSTDDEPDVAMAKTVPKNAFRQSGVAEKQVESNSEDDASRRGSIRHMDTSFKKVVLSSSEEEEVSPEIVPKRRPPMRPKPSESPDTSIIGRRRNKRMILLDSDTDNSFVKEHDKHKKMQCLKDTPLKIEVGHAQLRKATLNGSIMDQSDDDSSQSDDDSSNSDKNNCPSDKNKNKRDTDKYHKDENHHSDQSGTDEYYASDEKKKLQSKQNQPKKQSKRIQSDTESSDDSESGEDTEPYSKDEKQDNIKPKKWQNEKTKDSHESDKDNVSDKKNNVSGNDKEDSESYVSDDNQSEGDEGLEDKLVMSRATRMSIMGVMPKGGDSDESDFIVSDENTRSSSACSSLPDVSTHMNKSPPNVKPTEPDNDTSTLTCSPFSSPLHDVTNEPKVPPSSKQNDFKKPQDLDFKKNIHKSITPIKPVQDDDDVTFIEEYSTSGNKENEHVVDDDVTIIDAKPEIIALSSDDDEPDQAVKKSPLPKAEPTTARRSKTKETTIKQYIQPNSYPNQIVYVKKHVLENELSKLEGLKQDLHHVKYLIETMDLGSLPDGGSRMIERLTGLERAVRAQGDKVATFIVEPEHPTPVDMKNDGFGPVKPSWEELQKGSQAVQPRMFGKQAMATHMAERSLILERLSDLHASLDSRPAEGEMAAQPAAVRVPLMPHQLHALAWLVWRETQRPAGGILADDMGLGKTLTMISLVVNDKDSMIDDDDYDDGEDDVRARSKMARGGTLVVCPASLIQQWAAEVRKHCGPYAVSVCLHHGPARATHPHRLATHDMVVTTYNILQKDNDKNGVLMKIIWRRIILDEAHIVRNHKAATSVAVSALRGRRRWCLTGTPVHNKDLDLFALLKFLRCTPFDELTMWKKWIDNKSAGGQERLNTIMGCILLRRTKAQLQQKGQLSSLPTRTAHHVEVTLDKDEINVYQKVLVFSKTLFAQFLHQRAEKQGDVGAGNDAYYAMHKKMIALQGAKPVKSHEILVLLLRLRQVCCHCGLIAAMLDASEEQEDGAERREDPATQDLLDELDKLTLDDSNKKVNENGVPEEEVPVESTTVKEAIRSVLSPNNPVFSLERQSSKIRAVMECLQKNVLSKKGEKAVVVSQWTSVLRLVEVELKRARARSVTLSGSVPVPARAHLIDALNDANSDVRVMLLSLCAGGVGLNLCGANHLLLLDPHWNPQLEEQAQDRVYRVGQLRPVHIYRFMCVETVEQSIRKLQEAKLELADNVLTGARNTNASKLTIEDLKILFNMGPSQSDTQAAEEA